MTFLKRFSSRKESQEDPVFDSEAASSASRPAGTGLNQWRENLLYTGEGRILLLGLAMSLIFIALLLYYLTINPREARTLFFALVAHTFGGRAAGIGLCIAFGFSRWVTIGYNMFIEVLIVCYCYSLFVFSFKNYLNCRWLTIAAGNAEKQALKHKDVVARYGWLGIFAFVMIPLPITGPAAGSIIAYFLKFSIRRNFAAVFTGTLAAIIIWTYFFDYLDHHITTFKYVMIAILLVVFVCYFKSIKCWFTEEIKD
jgi:uncharacterized membrane protein